MLTMIRYSDLFSGSVLTVFSVFTSFIGTIRYLCLHGLMVPIVNKFSPVLMVLLVYFEV